MSVSSSLFPGALCDFQLNHDPPRGKVTSERSHSPQARDKDGGSERLTRVSSEVKTSSAKFRLLDLLCHHKDPSIKTLELICGWS